jgi:CheY-like chemotaxis protein
MLVSGMIKMLERLIGENIDLIWRPGDTLWTVNMDPTQIDQILANLTVNARDVITGQGTMIIETRNSTVTRQDFCGKDGIDPGEYVLLTVSDSGCGMTEENLSHLFEPFYTTKEVGKGTGLGLATVYGIVKQNNGFVNVFSSPGKGTSFKIYFPRFNAVETPVQSVKDVKPAGGKETILLVEDEPAILHLGKTILKKYGYTVLTSQTPAEALALVNARTDAIDLLITDVVMPQMNGKELHSKIRCTHPDLRCLFISGYTADAISHHGVLNENLNFLQKPFTARSLAVKIREVLSETIPAAL